MEEPKVKWSVLCAGVPLTLAYFAGRLAGYFGTRVLAVTGVALMGLALVPDLGKVVPIHLFGRLAIMV